MRAKKQRKNSNIEETAGSRYNLLSSIAEEISRSGISFDEAISFLKKKQKQPSLPKDIPVEIFANSGLSALEAIVKYLKENMQLSYSQIAFILNRNDRTVWATYNNSKKKMKTGFRIDSSSIKIPLSVIASRNLSVLESIAFYLHSNLNFAYHRIASLLNRDDRTVWTVCSRARTKLKDV